MYVYMYILTKLIYKMSKLEIACSGATDVFWESPAVNIQVINEKEDECMYNNTIKLQRMRC